MLQYKTKLEKSEKVQKSQNARSPLGGWGAGSKEPTQTCFLLLRVTIIHKLIEKMQLGSYTERTQGITKYNNNDYGRWSDPWGFRKAQKSLLGQHLLLFSDGPAKNQQDLIIIKFPKTL